MYIHMADDGLCHTVGRLRLRPKRSKGDICMHMAADGLIHTIGMFTL